MYYFIYLFFFFRNTCHWILVQILFLRWRTLTRRWCHWIIEVLTASTPASPVAVVTPPHPITVQPVTYTFTDSPPWAALLVMQGTRKACVPSAVFGPQNFSHHRPQNPYRKWHQWYSSSFGFLYVCYNITALTDRNKILCTAGIHQR